MKKLLFKFVNSKGAKNFVSHFVQGLIVVAPISITLFLLYKIFYFIYITFHLPLLIVNALLDPLIILLAIILFIYIVGRLSATLLFNPAYIRLEKDIEKVPFIRLVYTSVKDMLSAFVGSKRKFNQPVLVTIDKANDIKQLGFITQSDLSQINLDKEYVAVYVPFSYGLSGKLYIVHKNSVIPVDASPTDVMKFVISGGVTHVD
jgi:uncharacterized membrane protein